MRTLAFFILCLAWPIAGHAESAISVADNALWRVDLDTHEAELLAELDTSSLRFGCGELAVSRDGDIRCERQGTLYEIQHGAVIPLTILPGDPDNPYPKGLAFDLAGRLWFLADPSVLWQLDPSNGAVLSSRPLSLVGTRILALAAVGDRLYVFTDTPLGPNLLEEIDPVTGALLSVVDVSSVGEVGPVDAASGLNGDLWVTSVHGQVITGVPCFSYSRLELAPLSRTETWFGCVAVSNGAPTFATIDGIKADPAVEIPTLGVGGISVLGFLLLGVAWSQARRLGKSST